MLALILLMVVAVSSEENKYCEMESCPNRTHTLCKFPNFGLAERCGTSVRAEIAAHRIQSIVDFHNCYRQPDLFEYRENSEPLQTIASSSSFNPFFLEWDEELAFIAQRWANQCQSVTDECRNVDNINVTQRVDVREASSYIPSLFASIGRWYIQDTMERLNLKHLSLREISSSYSNLHNQMPWGYTNIIGCGIVYSRSMPYAYASSLTRGIFQSVSEYNRHTYPS